MLHVLTLKRCLVKLQDTKFLSLIDRILGIASISFVVPMKVLFPIIIVSKNVTCILFQLLKYYYHITYITVDIFDSCSTDKVIKILILYLCSILILNINIIVVVSCLFHYSLQLSGAGIYLNTRHWVYVL